MRRGWTAVSFTEVATLVRRPIEVAETGLYPEVGVRCFGKGLFHKAARNGLEVGDKKLFCLKKGDFILQVTFAWEGAIGIVSASDESLFGSVRVLTFEVDRRRTTPEFLYRYFQTKSGVEQLSRISPGSAGRNRVLAIQRLREMAVPLPPLAEQQRITDRLDAIENRLHRVQALREEQTKELQAALRSAYHRLEGRSKWLPMVDVMPLNRRPVEIEPDGRYPELGARSFGRGIFHKPTLKGDSLTWEKLFRVQAGDLVISNIKAWEGALAVASEVDGGRFGSHRYLTCTADRTRLLPEFACFYLLSPHGLEQIGNASPGSADRNRTLSVSRLEKILIPVPPLAAQREFQKLLALQSQVKARADESKAATTALLPSLLDQIFNG
jgi:type I restriction enzyme S subunit